MAVSFLASRVFGSQGTQLCDDFFGGFRSRAHGIAFVPFDGESLFAESISIGSRQWKLTRATAVAVPGTRKVESQRVLRRDHAIYRQFTSREVLLNGLAAATAVVRLATTVVCMTPEMTFG